MEQAMTDNSWPSIRRYAYTRLVEAGVSPNEAAAISWRFADCWREAYEEAKA